MLQVIQGVILGFEVEDLRLGSRNEDARLEFRV